MKSRRSNLGIKEQAGLSLLGVLIVMALVMVLAIPARSNAAGLLIADGGLGGMLELKQHEVKVTINNGIAVTHVTQVFLNTEQRQVEALYTFPVPKEASVANFSMWINGKEMVGEVIEKKRAREIYNSYKRVRRDPGLLEQVDYKTFEMRIFPINAGAQQKVQITYYQELEFDHDRAVYVYPLATATHKGINSRVTGKFSFDLDVKSAIPIVTLGSPSHGEEFITVNHSETFATASLETSGGSLAADLVVSYDLSRPKTGIDLITSKRAGEDGYFLMTLTAGEELKKLDTGMDYIFVMDISGSMGNDGKLVMSKNSVEAFINELGTDDRFEVMTFNINPNTLFNELRTASEQMKEEASRFMSTQQAKGGTILVPAINTAYRYGDPDRTLNVIILSDGMTEQQERQNLINLIQSRPGNARVFCVGIGNEVNKPLLEQMAEDSGGIAAFISRGDNFKIQARAFRRKLMHPAATDLVIDFEGLRVYDIEPKVLPSLYHGAPVRIYGRYAGSGEPKVSLKANIRGKEIKDRARLLFPAEDENNPEIERMWAWKRIDQLLKDADRSGSRQSVVDEIILLGEGYSIVTEYTSFLVLENDAEYKRWKIDRRNLLRIDRDRNAQAKLREELDRMRSKTAANIGPSESNKGNPKQVAKAPQPNIKQKNLTRQVPQQPAPPVEEVRSRRSFDFGGGSGPVGPLFIWGAYWLRRRKKANS